MAETEDDVSTFYLPPVNVEDLELLCDVPSDVEDTGEDVSSSDDSSDECTTDDNYEGKKKQAKSSKPVGNTFGCPFCALKFAHEDHLKIHMERHNDSKDQTSKSLTVQPDTSKLKNHEVARVDSDLSFGNSSINSWLTEVLKTGDEDSLTEHKADMKLHEISEESTDEILKCQSNLENSDSEVLIEKSNKNLDEKFICKICGKGYERNCHLERHLKSHNEFKKFGAHMLEDFFESKVGNMYDKIDRDSINRRFVCEICGKGFGRNSHLKRHVKLHTSEKGVGDKMPLKQSKPQNNQSEGLHTSKQSDALQGGHHDGKYPEESTKDLSLNQSFVCTVCGEAFELNQQLQIHMDSHKDQEDSATEMSPEQASPRLRVSVKKNASKASAKKNASKARARNASKASAKTAVVERQTQTQDFCCMFCDKSYGRKSHLTRHLKTHKGKEDISGEENPLSISESPSETTEEHSSSTVFVDPSMIVEVKCEPLCDFESLDSEDVEVKCEPICDFDSMASEDAYGDPLDDNYEPYPDPSALNESDGITDPIGEEVESSKMDKNETTSSVEADELTGMVKTSPVSHVSDCDEFSVIEHKKNIGRSFICQVCGKGYGRNSHLKRHLKIHESRGELIPNNNELSNHSELHDNDSLVGKVSKTSRAGHRKNLGNTDHFHKGSISVQPESMEVSGAGVEDELQSDVNERSEEMPFVDGSENQNEDAIGLDMQVDISTLPYAEDALRVSTMINEEKSFECSVCNIKFNKKELYEEHITLHISTSTQHDCKLCGERFIERASLDAHIHAVHSSRSQLDLNFQCPVCSKSFGRNSHLKRHMKLHTEGKSFACHVCGKSFAQKGNLKCHLKMHDRPVQVMEGGAFQCEICHESYSMVSLLREHVNTVHCSDDSLECEFCGKRFGRRSHLKRHLKLHVGGTSFDCKECGKTFKQNGNLKAHLQMVHSKKKNYFCPHCNKSFLKKSSLNSHIRQHKGET